MPEQVIKGEVIRITEVPEETTFVLEVDKDRAKRIGCTTYIEVDLAAPAPVQIQLPKISSLGGFLQLQLYVIDVGNTAGDEFNITIFCAPAEEGENPNRIMGGFSCQIVLPGQGVALTPVSNSVWYSDFGTNISNQVAAETTYTQTGYVLSEGEEEPPA